MPVKSKVTSPDSPESALRPSVKSTEAPTRALPKTNPAHEQVVLAPRVTNLITQVTRPRAGQPTKRTPEVEQELLDRIGRGETMVGVCQDAHMPGYSTVQAWCQRDPSFLAAIERAYEWHARVLDDIVDDMLAGGPTSTGDFRRDEARAGHIRWRLGKLNKRFRDKQDVDVNSSIHITMPPWIAPQLTSQAIEGEVLDVDAAYELETVKRLTGGAEPTPDTNDHPEQS